MSTTAHFKGFLFDMDGTLVDSTEAVNGAFDQWSHMLGLDPITIKAKSHGVRLVDSIKTWYAAAERPIQAAELPTKARAFEQNIIDNGLKLGEAGLRGIVALPGVAELLERLISVRNSWCLCTSGTEWYAQQCFDVALPGCWPKERITGDMCENGKPHPEPYIRGAAVLGVSPGDCLAVEDAPAGVTSGKQAGCKVLAVCTSHSRERMEQTEADWVCDDLTCVNVRQTEEGWEVVFDTAQKVI